MEQMKDALEELKNSWLEVYEKIKGSPTLYQPHLPYVNAEQINEIVDTVFALFGRIRAPRGFAPAFNVGKGLMAASLIPTVSSVKALQRGEYNHFPGFMAGLNQALIALHTMVVFSEKEESQIAVGDMAARLAETLALINTAQRELGEKSEFLQNASEAVENIAASIQVVEEHQARSTQSVDAIEGLKKTANEKLEVIKAEEESAKHLTTEINAGLDSSKELLGRLGKQMQDLESLTVKANAQEQLISNLLPKGASAGLAAAFAQRVGELEWTKKAWMVVFLISIIALVVLAFIKLPIADAHTPWSGILYRFPWIAPVVWLGWFSAVQYGNTIRLQEDYAFKEATSKAFAGYREHMEHMASVQLEEANTAMTMLAAKTIDILSREPLRIFHYSDKDVSPAHSFLDRLLGRTEQREVSGSSK